MQKREQGNKPVIPQPQPLYRGNKPINFPRLAALIIVTGVFIFFLHDVSALVHTSALTLGVCK